ncbi:MAG TPA: MFS transporter [Candidatus Dormibacteraeota bacterium]|nr:MFS transporter [Candidatus Dormibacteraeota bacterium]
MARSRSNPLINRDMGLLWAAQGLSYLGDQIFDTTLVVWIAAVLARGQTWAPLAVSGVLIAVAIPTLVIGPLAGVFVDRADKRRMMIATDGIRAALILALLVSTGVVGGFKPPVEVQLAAIYAVVFVTAAATQFFGPARIALVRDVVPEESRAQAQSLSQVNASVSTIIGPPLAVPVLFLLGIQWALIANALSFLVSLSLIALVRAPASEQPSGAGAPPSFFRELREGFEFAGRNVVVRTLLVSLFIVMLGGGALNALDVFFVIHNLNTSANLYGFIGASMGVGVLAGAVLAGRVAGSVGLNRMYWLSLFSFAVLLLIYARLTSFAVALVVLFVVGFPQAAVNVAAAPILMGATPRELLGRVFSLVNPIVAIAGIISTAGAGFLATSVLAGLHARVLGFQIGPYDTIFSAAGVLILVGALYAWVNLNRENASHDE